MANSDGSDELSKYRQMLKVGLPEGAVRNAMNRDGVNPSLLFDASAAAPAPAPPKSKPVPAMPAASALPPHPLHAGGGGGNDKSALHDQIKAMAANRNRRIEKEGPPAPPEKPKPKKSIDAVLPPGSKPSGMATASIADQVAMMAARRNQRMQGQETAEEDTFPPAQAETSTNAHVSPSVSASNPSPPVVTTMVTRSLPPPVTHTPVTTKKVEKVENKKGGFFGGSKKASKENPAPVPVSPAQEPYIIKSYKPEPIPVEQAKPPVFTQARLKSTGLRGDLPKEKEEKEEAATLQQAESDEAAKVGTTTTTITTVTTTKTKRVVKSDPEYDVTEYKVGCFCTVM